MIVICITDVWYCNTTRTKWNNWAPIKDSLYEVIEEISIDDRDYYLLRESPDPAYAFDKRFFREVDIDIKDIECEILEEATI